MHKCEYYDRLEILDGKIARVVTAIRAETRRHCAAELDIYREYEDGYAECRNLYYGIFGYYVSFPNEIDHIERGLDFMQTLQPFDEVKPIRCFPSRMPTADELGAILGKYPEFKYVLAKWHGSIGNTLKALRLWKSHREVEMLLAAGFEKLAFNKALYRLSPKKKREIVRFIRAHGDCNNFSLLDIQRCLKNRYDVAEYKAYRNFCHMQRTVPIELYRYLVKVKGDVWLYMDYMRMLARTEHDASDPYWKYPKDLQKAHDKVRDEVERLRTMKQTEELKKKQELYAKAVKKLLGHNGIVDGYEIYVPSDVSDWQLQARALHQCIVASDYIGSVIKKKCVLVFIRKCGLPVATAQVFNDGKIGQFYGNELDRENCLPSDEVRLAFNKWLSNARLNVA